jgi:hypothetical protein
MAAAVDSKVVLGALARATMVLVPLAVASTILGDLQQLQGAVSLSSARSIQAEHAPSMVEEVRLVAVAGLLGAESGLLAVVTGLLAGATGLLAAATGRSAAEAGLSAAGAAAEDKSVTDLANGGVRRFL